MQLGCVSQDSGWAIPSCRVGVNVPDLFSSSEAVAQSWMLKACGWIAPHWRHRCARVCVKCLQKCLNIWEFKSTCGSWHLISWKDTLQRRAGGNELFIPDSCFTKGGVHYPHVQSHLEDIDTSLVLTPLLIAVLDEKMQKGRNLCQERGYWEIKLNTFTADDCSAWVHMPWGDHLCPWDATRGFAPQWAVFSSHRGEFKDADIPCHSFPLFLIRK